MKNDGYNCATSTYYPTPNFYHLKSVLLRYYNSYLQYFGTETRNTDHVLYAFVVYQSDSVNIFDRTDVNASGYIHLYYEKSPQRNLLVGWCIGLGLRDGASSVMTGTESVREYREKKNGQAPFVVIALAPDCV